MTTGLFIGTPPYQSTTPTRADGFLELDRHTQGAGPGLKRDGAAADRVMSEEER